MFKLGFGGRTDQGSGLLGKQCAPMGVGFESSFLREGFFLKSIPSVDSAPF
jgi:hypothetical protein